MSADLIDRLRALSRYAHDDLSIGDEAADEIERLRKDAAAPKILRASNALLDVLLERRRQIEVEGWTPEHDDEHQSGELASAAAVYALATTGIKARRYWPWHANGWIKPAPARRNLVKASALLLAELERLDRAAMKESEW